MNIKKIFLDGLINILNNKYKFNEIALENFFNNNKKTIFQILDDPSTQTTISRAINHLQLDKKNYLLSLVYLNLLCEKFPNNDELRLITSKTCYQCALYDMALSHLHFISPEKYSKEHYQVLTNIYLKLEYFHECIATTKKLRLIENINSTNTLILIYCLRRIRKINEAKLELENLKRFHKNDFEFFYNETLIELLENKFSFVLDKLINAEGKYSGKEYRFHEVYSLILRKYGKFNESIDQLKLAYSLGLNDISSYTYSLYLSKSDFSNGYLHLDRATNNIVKEKYFISIDIKKWNFENLEDSTLFVYAGKGIALGDKIYFYRYLIDIISRYKGLHIFLCGDNLRDKYIFEYQNINYIKFDKINNFINVRHNNFYASLPLIVKIYNERLSINYLKHIDFLPFHKEKNNFWKREINKIDNKIKIGINWKGDIKYKLDVYRSLELKKLKNIFEINNVTFIILNNQIDDDEEKFISKYNNIILFDKKKFSDENQNTFSETIEIMRNLDLIISTDTALAHLASSLNLKTFLMLEYTPFWYWELDEKNNLYNNLNLRYFKQKEPGNWDLVIKNVMNEIKTLS